MAQTTGTPQVVRQGIAESISYRLLNLITGAGVTITSASVVVVTPSGTVIAPPGEVVAFSGFVATLSFTPTAALFPVADGYRVIWTLNGTIKRTQFFDVVLRIFESQVIDSDITAIYQGITLPTGTDWSAYRLRAWRKIEMVVRKAIKGSPHTVFYPERFFEAHISLSVAEFFLPDTFDRTGEEYLKYQHALREGLDLLRQVMATLDYDADGDGLISTGDTGHDLRPWTQREWEML